MTKLKLMQILTLSAAMAGIGQGFVTGGHAAEASTSAAAGDAKRGQKLYLQCQACHSAAPGGPNLVGPNLFGIVGASAAKRPGYRYSPALSRSGISWTPANLDAWLRRPTALVPGTTMAFVGVADARNRADIIAYLSTLKTKR